MRRIALALLALLVAVPALAGPPPASLRYRSMLTREAQLVFGLNAPIPMLAAQIEQESSWKADETAYDLGRGLAQFMDATAADIASRFPELGKPMPYDPAWAMRAQTRYDRLLFTKVRGDTDCDRWAAALKAYNAGLGYVLAQQKASAQPGKWFDATELVPTRQSEKNQYYSRMYPRWILLKRQANYVGWGTTVCM